MVAQIVKRKTSKGDFRYDVRTRINGRLVTKTFKRRRDVDAYATVVEANRLRGVAIDPRRAKVTLKEYSTAWMASRNTLAERTVELYQWLLDRHINPSLGAVALGDLTPSRVRSWQGALSKAHPSVAAKAYRLLSSIMRTAIADEVISRNPCQVKGAGMEAAAERPMATVAEVGALAEVMPANLRVLVLLAAWCQLRRAELLGLRRRDVDPLHGLVTVEVTRTTTMGGRTIQKPPKSKAGRRTVAIPSHVTTAVAAHLQDHVAGESDALLFPVTNRALDVAWDKARKAVKRPELHLNDLRHAGLTWAAASGATIAELMHRGGHASPAAALRYQHATKDRDKVLAGALAKLASAAEVVELGQRDGCAMEDVSQPAANG